MFLFIFESIGTSELILIGIVALIFLGPRRMPEIARKVGKMMAEFRNTTNEFRTTWEREVNFEKEAEALRSGIIEDDGSEKPVARLNSITEVKTESEIAMPEIKEIEPADFEAMRPGEPKKPVEPDEDIRDADADKRNWL